MIAILALVALVGTMYYLVPKVGEYIDMKEEKKRMTSQRMRDLDMREAILVTPRICPECDAQAYNRDLTCRKCGSQTVWGVQSFERWSSALHLANGKKAPEHRRTNKEIEQIARRISSWGPKKSRGRIRIVERVPAPEELGCM